ncbi:glycosyl hydrolase [Massilia forsythiae]|nr:glycosyl hydrolase [Massilia forsythiae]
MRKHYSIFACRLLAALTLSAAAAALPATAASAPTTSATHATLSDPDATPATRALYAWLRGIWGKQIIAGQQDLTWNDGADMARRVFDDTGKYPALMGYDFMNSGLAGPDAQGAHQVDEAIAFARRGGLVTFCWHWRDPARLAVAGAGRGNFYARERDAAKNTGFTIPMKEGRLDTASPGYAQLDAGIDLVAGELRRLADAGVVVLWRPLHEASGNKGDGWFWWGRTRGDGVPQAQAYIQLWRHMHERLVRTHGLHNLVWVWNGQDPAWYPGDDVVDVVGYDIYDDDKNGDAKAYKSQAATYRAARAIGNRDKPVALSETSYIPDPDKMLADGAPWLWFTVWNDGHAPAGATDKDNFWSGDYYNTLTHKNKVYHHPNVITLDKLPAFLKAPQ